jgi:phosphorylcholine metabolism protein LicD
MKLLKDYSPEELHMHKQGQLIMTDMLKEFDHICRSNGLKYWCVCGTLIGAVRHKGWIPFDADIDVAMLKSDYEKLQNIIQKKLSKDYWFQDKSTDKYYKSNIGKIRYLYAQYDDYKCQNWHNGIQLDIFVFYEEGHLLNPHMVDSDITIINKDNIFPLKTLEFENIQVYVPNNYKKYLIHFFDGCPPPILPSNQQYPHEGRIVFTIPEWMIKKYPELYKKKQIFSSASHHHIERYGWQYGC